MSNIGRAILKKLAVKFEGNEIMSVYNYDIFTCYRDLWKTKSVYEVYNYDIYSHVTEIYGKLSQKREMPSDKASSLLTGAQKTALN